MRRHHNSLSGTPTPPPRPEPTSQPFYIENISAVTGTVVFQHSVNAPSITLEYTSATSNWDSATWNTLVSATAGTASNTDITLSPGQRIYIRNSQDLGYVSSYTGTLAEFNAENTDAGNTTSHYSYTNRFYIPRDAAYRIGGNLRSLALRYYDDTLQIEATADSWCAFAYLFYNCVGLRDASMLRMGNIIMKEAVSYSSKGHLAACYCFESMFEGCEHMSTAPIFPGENQTVKPQGCFKNFFRYCRSLAYIDMSKSWINDSCHNKAMDTSTYADTHKGSFRNFTNEVSRGGGMYYCDWSLMSIWAWNTSYDTTIDPVQYHNDIPYSWTVVRKDQNINLTHYEYVETTTDSSRTYGSYFNFPTDTYTSFGIIYRLKSTTRSTAEKVMFGCNIVQTTSNICSNGIQLAPTSNSNSFWIAVRRNTAYNASTVKQYNAGEHANIGFDTHWHYYCDGGVIESYDYFDKWHDQTSYNFSSQSVSMHSIGGVGFNVLAPASTTTSSTATAGYRIFGHPRSNPSGTSCGMAVSTIICSTDTRSAFYGDPMFEEWHQRNRDGKSYNKLYLPFNVNGTNCMLNVISDSDDKTGGYITDVTELQPHMVTATIPSGKTLTLKWTNPSTL